MLPTQSSILNPGVLYVVATPIGNLEDITLRALRILKEVDFILCEDKRVTTKLLNKYEIKSNLISLHKYNEQKLINHVLSILQAGKNAAIVSDAGTPLISDPGLSLISFLRKNNITIIPIPGSSALVSTLSISPFKSNEFLFVGFLPDNKTEREKLIRSFSERADMIVLFVSPHDFNKYLKEIYSFYPFIEVFYARELTKFYEENWLGSIKDLIINVEKKKLKGEIVLCLQFESKTKSKKNIFENSKEIIDNIKTHVTNGYSLKEASKLLAKQYGLSSKNLYDLYIKTKN